MEGNDRAISGLAKGSRADSPPPTTFDSLACVLVCRATEAKLTARILEYIVDGFCTSLGAGPDDATITGIALAS